MHHRISLLLLVAGVGLAIGWAVVQFHAPAKTIADDSKPAKTPSAAELQAEIDRLKGLLPDQSHAMMDVEYHFSNLWFAAQKQNWPLAEFYWGETRSHLRWAVRIKPIRQDSAKRDVKLVDILQSVENTPLKQLHEAIQAKDTEQFVAAYKFTLEACYSCHKASEKPYLRPHIPQQPEARIINPDPKATWPQ